MAELHQVCAKSVLSWRVDRQGHGLVARAGFQWQIIRTWIRTAKNRGLIQGSFLRNVSSEERRQSRLVAPFTKV